MKFNKRSPEDMLRDLNEYPVIRQFVSDNTAQSGMSEAQANAIKEAVYKYRLNCINEGDTYTFVTGDLGALGHIHIKHHSLCKKDAILDAKPGYYNQVRTQGGEQRCILITDYSDVEPYNRQGGLYVGYRFDDLGPAIVESVPDYRIFDVTFPESEAIYGFALWTVEYNTFWKSIHFGLAMRPMFLDDFLNEIRTIINK